MRCSQRCSVYGVSCKVQMPEPCGANSLAGGMEKDVVFHDDIFVDFGGLLQGITGHADMDAGGLHIFKYIIANDGFSDSPGFIPIPHQIIDQNGMAVAHTIVFHPDLACAGETQMQEIIKLVMAKINIGQAAGVFNIAALGRREMPSGSFSISSTS